MIANALAKQRRGTFRQREMAGAALSQTLPAPVGGWNARDSEDAMAPIDAVILDNFMPGFGSVRKRDGYSEYATGVGSASSSVETLAEFINGTSRKMLAAANGSIYDVSSSGTASSLATGFSEDRWQWANFDGKMGLVNGTDAPQQFNGTTVSSLSISGSGLTSSDLIGITVFKNRTFFWERDSQDFWYSALNTLGGSLTKFQLSRVGDFGGKLVGIGSWSRDGGDGPDDVFCAAMSSGEVIVYQGTDPSLASTWAQVGVYQTGEPLDVRGFVKLGADLVVITTAGYRSVAQLLAQGGTGSADPAGSVSSKIDGDVIKAANDYRANTGWQAILTPNKDYLIVNVPVSTTRFDQHVMNTVNRTWCRWLDIPSYCWGVYNNTLYFGGLGTVYSVGGAADDGAEIQADAQQAFSQLGLLGTRKLVTGVEPALRGSGDLTLRVGVNTDFGYQEPVTVATTFGEEGAFWDDIGTFWSDNTETWDANQDSVIVRMTSAGGDGFRIAPRLIVSTTNTVEWLSTRIVFKTGGAQ